MARRVFGCAAAFRWWWLIWLAAGLCVFLCGVTLGVVSGGGAPGESGWFQEIFSPPFGGRERVTILALGIDESQGRGLADTVIAAVVWPRAGEIAALSVPRDTRAYIPGFGPRRINEAHALGELPLMVETVEFLLGIPFDYYVEVNVPGLVQLVNAMGGIDLEVGKRMYYRDRAQNLLIDLRPGFQHLDGEKAVGYVRFRHDAKGDLGRIERQRTFLRAAARQLLAPHNVWRVRKLSETFVETVNTNLTVRDMINLKKILDQTGADAIRMATLPGNPRMIHGQSMLELDQREAQRTVNRILWGEGLTVVVLNATDVSGLAARTAARLQDRGCEVLEVANAQRQADTTLVLHRRGQVRRAQRVAALLGRGVISPAPDQDNPADVTVLLGRDMVGAAP